MNHLSGQCSALLRANGRSQVKLAGHLAIGWARVQRVRLNPLQRARRGLGSTARAGRLLEPLGLLRYSLGTEQLRFQQRGQCDLAILS